MKKFVSLINILCILILLFFSGCTILEIDDIETKYDYIQSYPGGGGIFPIFLKSTDTIVENISISLISDPELQAYITPRNLNNNSYVAEVLIRPTKNISDGIHKIILFSTDYSIPKGLALEVEIFNISYSNPSNYIIEKRDELINWLVSRYPEYENISESTWFSYRTYIQILVVEHWTFLSDDYELRLCCHITNPPYNWSKMMLRHRGQINPVHAFHRQYDGYTYEINVSDYPTFYGY